MIEDVEKFFDKQDKKKEGYRATGKAFFLTYPKCDIKRDEAYTMLAKQWNPSNLIVAQEDHKDGTPHLHVYMQLPTKKNFKNPRWADLGKYHGFYTTVRDRQAVMAYVMKDGNFKMNENLNFTTWHNFRKEKGDFDAWIIHNESKKLKSPYPFKLPDGTDVLEPKLGEKKCNHMIIGIPDTGKSFWYNTTFEGKRVFSRVDGKYPFDDYEGQEVVIYNDPQTVTLMELINVSDCYLVKTPVFGDTRYTKKYWKMKQRRTIIFICNHGRIPNFVEDPAFRSRFNIWDMGDDEPEPEEMTDDPNRTEMDTDFDATDYAR
ncbi:replication-associated protein [Odonata-associated circular virus-8]|uniref:replication-associated protein n=1 Tax=Odonata-associated circular virus-8 TaxID=1592128 RepID=UPI000586489B|nr:replication-associated protein [Odonata-associated circular virus-8]AJD07473.1 replication-associated protein [Odonata-associated circular virus-8]